MKARASTGRALGSGSKALRTIPAMPAIRPEKSINPTADNPINAPPASEAKGVKSVVIEIANTFLAHHSREHRPETGSYRSGR